MKINTLQRIIEVEKFLQHWNKAYKIEKIKGRWYIVFTPKCCGRTKRIGLYRHLDIREWGICPRCQYRMVRFGHNDMITLKDNK